MILEVENNYERNHTRGTLKDHQRKRTFVSWLLRRLGECW